MNDERCKSYYRRCFKIGSSVALTLPSWYVKQNSINPEDLFEIVERSDSVTIRKMTDGYKGYNGPPTLAGVVASSKLNKHLENGGKVLSLSNKKKGAK